MSVVSDDAFLLQVRDRGRGMTADQIANLGAYMQFERKLYEQQGSGLGLVLAQRLTQLASGYLTIDSILHQETTVHLSLPFP